MSMLLRLVTVLVAAALLASPLRAETFRFQQWLPPQHPIVTRTLMPWIADVEAATEGRVQIQYLPAPLGPPPAQFDMVRDGVVDFALSVHGFTPARFTLPTVAELPFSAFDSEALSVALWRTYAEYFAEADEHEGVQLLSMWSTKPGHVWTREVAVDTTAAFQGLKLMGGNSINVAIAEALGAVPVQAPPSQTYELLQRGIVDGAFLDHSSYKDFNLGPFLKHVTQFERGLYAGTLYLMVNPAAWERISPEDRAAIMELSGEALARRAGANWDAAAAESIALMQADGISVVTPSEAMVADLRDKLAFLEADWVARAGERGIDGAAARAFLLEQVSAVAAGQ